MFDINLAELIVIGTVALIVIGPKKLPKVARTVGYLMGRAQRYLNEVKLDIARDMELNQLKKIKTEIDEVANGIESSMEGTSKELSQKVKEEIAVSIDDSIIQSVENPLEQMTNDEEKTEKK